jgi:ribosomal protein S12 methylthiotransferase accessory factor YcaO
VGAKDGGSLLAGVKAIGEVVHDLHTEVFYSNRPLRHTAAGFFSTVDDLLENGILTPADQDWLEKKLAEMEQKLRAYKRGKAEIA